MQQFHNKFISTAASEKKLLKLVRSLSLKQKVGQLMYPGVKGDYLSDTSDEMKYYKHLIKEWGIGGFVLFTGTVYDYAHLITQLQSISELPLLFSADFERGLWMRIPNATPFPHQMGIAETGDLTLAENIAYIIGKESRSIGIYQNFSPVADLYTNPDNPIVNIRAFSENPKTAGKFCAAFVRGYRRAGVLSCAKHFPGHGNTAEDSHKELPVVRGELSLLMKRELAPFIQSIKSGVDGIMPAHIAVPAIDSNINNPASLSTAIIRKFLRKRLKFTGLVSSDAMAMQAITDNFPVGEAAVRAVEAGNEQLLMSPHPEIALEAIYDAVKIGRISEALLEEAVMRVLSAKYSLGWNKMRTIDFAAINKTVYHSSHKAVSEKASEKSFAFSGAQPEEFRLKKTKKGLLVLFTDAPVLTNETVFKEMFAGNFTYEQVVVTENAGPAETASLLKKCKNSEVIVAAVFVRVRAFRGYLHFPEPVMKAIAALNSPVYNTRFISFGSPTLFKKMEMKQPVMYCYSDSPVTQETAVKKLL